MAILVLNTGINGLDNLEILGEVKIETFVFSFSFNLVNYYEPKGNNLSTAIEAIQSFLGLGPDLILVGDLNSKELSIGCKNENQNGQILEEIFRF